MEPRQHLGHSRCISFQGRSASAEDVRYLDEVQSDQVKTYTSQLFEHYMDYKLLLRQLQIIIKDPNQFETKYGLVNALDTSLDTLLSVKAVFRAEQAKIVRAVDYLSKKPDSIRDKLPPSNLKLAGNVRTILEQLLPSQRSSILGNTYISAPESTSTVSTTNAGAEESHMTFDFASLIPPEVWSDVMPVPRKDGKYSSQPGAISLGDFKLPPTPEAALAGAQTMSAPQSSILPQLDDAKRYQELQEMIRKETDAKNQAIKDKEAVDAQLQEADAKLDAKEGEIKTLQQQNESKTTELKALESKVTEAKVARADEITVQRDLAVAAQSRLTEAETALNAEKDKVTKVAADLTSRTNELTDTRTKLAAAEDDIQTWKSKYETSERDKITSFNDATDLRNRRLPNEDSGTEDGLWILLAHFGGVDYANNATVRRNIRDALDNRKTYGQIFGYGWSYLFDNNDPRPGSTKSIAIAYRWNKTGHINIINAYEGQPYTF